MHSSPTWAPPKEGELKFNVDGRLGESQGHQVLERRFATTLG